MTAPVPAPRETESIAVDAAFEAALLAIGVESIEDALALWEDVPAGSTAAVAADWLAKAVALMMSHRTQARDLAVAYYRLARALRTGTTIPDPNHPTPDASTITLSTLRFEFEQAVNAAPHGGAGSPAPSTPTTDTPETPQAGTEGSSDEGGDTEIPIEQIDGIEEIEPDLSSQAEEQVRELLTNLGPVHQEKLASKIDTNKPAKEVDVARQDAHDRAGARQASAAEHTVLNGGRGTVFSLAEKDRRVIGWVRASRTGTPCGFCAMLISRGPMLKDQNGDPVREAQVYSSERSATYTDDGDLYHLNCHCYAVPIYSMAQWNNDPKYDLNRQYAVLWPKVTDGLSGDDALRAWRRFIDAQNADQSNPPATAQAA